MLNRFSRPSLACRHRNIIHSVSPTKSWVHKLSTDSPMEFSLYNLSLIRNNSILGHWYLFLLRQKKEKANRIFCWQDKGAQRTIPFTVLPLGVCAYLTVHTSDCLLRGRTRTITPMYTVCGYGYHTRIGILFSHYTMLRHCVSPMGK